jgi:3-oxoadipate enol-lactonase
MPQRRVGDVELYYRLIDCTEPWRSGRAPVLFVHGLGGDQQMWLYQVPAFCSEFPVLLVDLRGHGRSSAPSGAFTVADLAGDLARLLCAIGAERVHLVGAALGGLVALQFALDYPHATASLVLAGTAAGMPEALAAAAPAALRFILEHDMPTVAAARITAAFSDAVDPVMRDYFIDRVGRNEKSTYEHAARAAFAFRSAPRLPEIAAPALVVVGACDRVTPPPLVEELAARLRNARLARLPGAGHLCNLEQSTEFNRVVLDFLRGM